MATEIPKVHAFPPRTHLNTVNAFSKEAESALCALMQLNQQPGQFERTRRSNPLTRSSHWEIAPAKKTACKGLRMGCILIPLATQSGTSQLGEPS